MKKNYYIIGHCNSINRHVINKIVTIPFSEDFGPCSRDTIQSIFFLCVYISYENVSGVGQRSLQGRGNCEGEK